MHNMCESNDKTGQSFQSVNCFLFPLNLSQVWLASSEKEKDKLSRKLNNAVILSQHLCRCELALAPAFNRSDLYDKLYINREHSHSRLLNRTLKYANNILYEHTHPVTCLCRHTHTGYNAKICQLLNSLFSALRFLFFKFLRPFMSMLNSIRRDILFAAKRLNFMKISTCTEIKEIWSATTKYKTLGNVEPFKRNQILP